MPDLCWSSSRLTALILACACLGDGSAIPADAPKPIIDFASAAAPAQGGAVGNVVYSQNPNDAALTRKDFADGVLTVVGQVGMGKASQWAGMGVTTNIGGEGVSLDASGYKSISFKLSATAPTKLRVRIVGDEKEINLAGCYPIVMQAVTSELTEYTVPLSAFASEGWCGGKSRSVAKTISALSGFEVDDTNMNGKETSFSLAAVRLNP